MPTDYHDRIMSITPNRSLHNHVVGHRDARHAAAEIALEADAEIARLRMELRYIENCPPSTFRPAGHDKEWYERLILDMQSIARAALESGDE